MLSRRQFAGIAAATVGLALPARAQTPQPSGDGLYFVPGGRIGFRRPVRLISSSHGWRLNTPDQTFAVHVSERLRVSTDWDSVIWEPHDRHKLLKTDRFPAGFEHQHFRDRGFGDSIDYSGEFHAFRDRNWLGGVSLSTRRLGPFGPPKTPDEAGLIARWRGAMDEVAASITIRPTLSVADALAEFRIGIATDGLHPRFSGDHLYLSVAPPKMATEMIGLNVSHISIPDLGILPLRNPDAADEAYRESFKILRDMPGSRVVEAASTRSVIRAERPPLPTTSRFTSHAEAFGRSRTLRLTASYDAASRGPTMQALERILATLSLPDAA